MDICKLSLWWLRREETFCLNYLIMSKEKKTEKAMKMFCLFVKII